MLTASIIASIVYVWYLITGSWYDSYRDTRWIADRMVHGASPLLALVCIMWAIYLLNLL